MAEEETEEEEAEEAADVELEEEALGDGELSAHPEWALPLDFTPGQEPDASLYSESTYEDDTIRVRIEEQSMDDGTKMFVARIQISDPSQIRTGVANPEKLGSSKTKTVGAMAKTFNAVIAINGDNYVDKPEKTTFEYRMTQKIRSKSNKTKDILVIDDQGDFHLFVKSIPSFSVLEIVRRLKQVSTRRLWKECPDYLRKYYWKGHPLWTSGYYCSTVGAITEESVIKYIQNNRK